MTTVEISKFEHNGQTFSLNKPLSFTLEHTGVFWCYENEVFNFQGCGQSKDDALKNLNQDLASFYHEIALENDDNLDGSAVEMKRRFLNLLESVVLPLGNGKCGSN